MCARRLPLVLALVAAGACLPGCSADLRDGLYGCTRDEECPSGWVCVASLCYRSADAATGIDAAHTDAGGPGDAFVPPIDAGMLPCDPDETPATSGVVFVRPGGTGDGTSPSSPIGTIAAALPLALTGRPHLLLAEGTYAETIDLDAPLAGLIIDGGWATKGSLWERDCENGRAATLLASPGPFGLRVSDATGGFELRHVTIETAPPGMVAPDTAGGSRFGLVVRGASSAVTLFDVLVRARDGEGAGASSAAAPAAAPTCDGTTCGDAAGGSVGAAGPDGMPAEAFDGAGYTAIDGTAGTMGGPGHDGMPGGMGYRAATNHCGLCNFGGDCSTVCTQPVDVPTGRCGCGGRPGGPGRPGRGGGASVGLLVAGMDAVVSATWSTFESGSGGAGASGSAMADPSPPTDGTPGTARGCSSCDVTNPGPCGSGDSCACYMQSCTDYSTTPGTRGGSAGASGAGGGGTGGPSYAVVRTEGARFVSDATVTLAGGAGGPGGGTANDGHSGDLH